MAGKKMDEEDTRDVFEKALDNSDGALPIGLITGAVIGGILGRRRGKRGSADIVNKKTKREYENYHLRDGVVGGTYMGGMLGAGGMYGGAIVKQNAAEHKGKRESRRK